MEGGIDPFHGQVGALDHTHLDARPAGVHTGRGPVLETLHGGQGVREVGLQHNAGFVAGQVLLVEDGGENGDGQIEVLVVLHVKVEEGAVIPGQAVQGREHLDSMGDDLLEAPRVVGTGDGRNLDGDVVDVVADHEAGDLSQAPSGLPVPQDGLAQQVDVQAVAAGAQPGQGGTQPPVGGVDDKIADELAEDAARHSGHGARGQSGRPATQSQGPGQRGRQKVGARGGQTR